LRERAGAGPARPFIEAGAARSYFVAVGPAAASGERSGVCVIPRGAREGVPQVAQKRSFALVVGKPVRFDLFASDVVTAQPGDLMALDEERFERLPPLATTLRAEGARGEVRVALEGELTPVDTLDLACVEIEPAPSTTPRRFRLAFQLRGSGEEGAAAG